MISQSKHRLTSPEPFIDLDEHHYQGQRRTKPSYSYSRHGEYEHYHPYSPNDDDGGGGNRRDDDYHKDGNDWDMYD